MLEISTSSVAACVGVYHAPACKCAMYAKLMMHLCACAFVTRFGPLVFTIIMATRQLLATILSSFIYGHTIKALGFVGAGVVFGAVALRIYLKSRKASGSAGYKIVPEGEKLLAKQTRVNP